MNNFTKTFKEIQRKKDISLSSVAIGAGLNVVSVGRALRKENPPPLSTVIALATGLGLTIWDRDTFVLLNSAGYELSDLSPHTRAILRDWPRNEGFRVGVYTVRMQVSIMNLIAADLLNTAPNEEMRKTAMEIHYLLDKAATLGSRLNRQLEAYQGPNRSFSGYRRYTKSKVS